jgi:sugar fermentation stimulation protein A
VSSIVQSSELKNITEDKHLAPQDKGLYLLVLKLKVKQNISAGKLKTTEFKPGIYLYIGSAQNGLLRRIVRHLRKKKKTFWHTDYLLQRAQIEEVWVKRNVFDECKTLQDAKNLLKNSIFPLKKFGSSDCRCPSHLIYLPKSKADFQSMRQRLSFEKVNIHEIQA